MNLLTIILLITTIISITITVITVMITKIMMMIIIITKVKSWAFKFQPHSKMHFVA